MNNSPTYTFPTFTWEEEDYGVDAGQKARVSSQPSSAFIHGSTRIAGKEGVLPDTGAVHNLTSLGSVLRQEQHAKTAGRSVQWQRLDKPKNVAGVGDNAKQCTHQAILPCGLTNGEQACYAAPVIKEGSDIPSLLGLESMAKDNGGHGTRRAR